LRSKSHLRTRGDIGLGDLAKALIELNLSETSHLHLAFNVLGFEGPTYSLQSKPKVAAESRLRKPTKPIKQDQKIEPRFSLPPTPEVSIQPSGGILESTLTQLPLAALSNIQPDWLQRPELETSKKTGVLRKRLFSRNHSSGIIKASLAVRRPGRRLNISKIITQAITGNSITKIPHLPVGSIENGVDLLSDYSESMQPFYSDLADLITSLQDILGKGRCRSFEYNTNPVEAISWNAQDRAIGWEPIVGRPVLLATDFGQAKDGPLNRVQFRDWRKFVNRAAKHNTPLIVLSPMPPSTLPRWLRQEAKIIHWDPRTRAGAVSKIIGIGHTID
jgi:hypothetical protein